MQQNRASHYSELHQHGEHIDPLQNLSSCLGSIYTPPPREVRVGSLLECWNYPSILVEVPPVEPSYSILCTASQISTFHTRFCVQPFLIYLSGEAGPKVWASESPEMPPAGTRFARPFHGRSTADVAGICREYLRIDRARTSKSVNVLHDQKRLAHHETVARRVQNWVAVLMTTKAAP